MGVGVGVGVGVLPTAPIGSPIAVGLLVDGEGVGVGLGIATPLFQIKFFPDWIQVKSFPELVAVKFFFVHFAPALGAAAFKGVVKVSRRTTPMAICPPRRIYQE